MSHTINALKLTRRVQRRRRVGGAVRGNAARPRLSVFRSLKNIYVQIIDDESGRTLAAASSADKAVRAAMKSGGNKQAATAIGKAIAEKAIASGITQVAFDRGGYQYHGRVKALADAAREGGLKF